MPTVLLIPGLVSDAVVWAGVTAILPSVVADVTTQADIPEMARDLLARHPGRLILAGHSMGGRALLRKSAEGRSTASAGQTYPARCVIGVPRAVKRFRVSGRMPSVRKSPRTP
jgi:pimeloyl-ACP methyl ester carboxylesterase